MGPSCLLGIFCVVPASKSSLFGHIINPHNYDYVSQQAWGQDGWILSLFLRFYWPQPISSHWDDLMHGLKHGSKGTLTSHQCGLGFKFRCLHPERFFSRHPVSPSSQKPIFPNSNLTRSQVDEEPLVKVLPLNDYLFIYFIYKLYREI